MCVSGRSLRVFRKSFVLRIAISENISYTIFISWYQRALANVMYVAASLHDVG